jgi:hypothetical protein
MQFGAIFIRMSVLPERRFGSPCFAFTAVTTSHIKAPARCRLAMFLVPFVMLTLFSFSDGTQYEDIKILQRCLREFAAS